MISPNTGLPAQRPMPDGSIQVLPGSIIAKRSLDDWRRIADRTVYPCEIFYSSSTDVTFTLDNTNIALSAANRTGFVVLPTPSTRQTITVQPGSLYFIGSDTVSLGSDGVLIDSSTIRFPATTDLSTKLVSYRAEPIERIC